MSTTTTARHALRDDHGNVVFDWARECPEYTTAHDWSSTSTPTVPADVREFIYAGANRLAKAGAR